MSDFIGLFGISFVLSFLGLFILGGMSFDFKWLVSKNRLIPQIGGIVFSFVFIGVFLSFVYWRNFEIPLQLNWILACTLVLLLIEVFDDIKEFSLFTRIILQSLFFILFLWHGKRIQIYFFPEWLNYITSFIWVAAITNVFNLLDIKDGLCSGISFVVSVCFLCILVLSSDYLSAFVLASLSGVIFSLLLLNFPPAKVYMGNSGAHVLGFLFASFAIHGDYATLDNPLVLFIPVVILAFPIIDTVFLIVVRMRKGIFPLRKSNDHLFMKLVASGWSFKKTLLYIYIINIFWAISAVYLFLGRNSFSFLFLACAVLFTLSILLRPGKSKSVGRG